MIGSGIWDDLSTSRMCKNCLSTLPKVSKLKTNQRNCLRCLGKVFLELNSTLIWRKIWMAENVRWSKNQCSISNYILGSKFDVRKMIRLISRKIDDGRRDSEIFTLLESLNVLKMAYFALLESPKLISRKIWVTEKSWNFHTVMSLLEFSVKMKTDYSNVPILELNSTFGWKFDHFCITQILREMHFPHMFEKWCSSSFDVR